MTEENLFKALVRKIDDKDWREGPEPVCLAFTFTVPEIYQGLVEIKHCARIFGDRSFIVVASRVETLDPVYCCVGMRGSRCKQVAEFFEERIDIIPWTENIAILFQNCLHSIGGGVWGN